ncbi:PAS domain-containing serine/threonine-protein kinase-like isoform X2 [Ptychodera flava]|uniref:PAS domain-containing serine/threonine-protein kinase-like isoform X2 n=1 Tax=Ptychodera flava TaxID=63121 RepID=UPI003969CB7E
MADPLNSEMAANKSQQRSVIKLEEYLAKQQAITSPPTGHLGHTLPPRPSTTSPVASPYKHNFRITPPLGRSIPALSKSLGGTMRTGEQFGTPSYPSPLDRIRTGKRERAAQLGLSTTANTSFDLNQSFPKPDKSKFKKEDEIQPSEPLGCTLEKFTGDELHSFSFAPGHSKGSFAPSPDLNLNLSMGASWSFYNYVGGGQTGVAFPTTVRNPNKAIVTIEARSTKILVANDMACELFSYKAEELVGVKLSELLSIPNQKKQEALMETHLEPSGEVVVVSGKVMEAKDSTGLVIPVSLWMKKLTKDDNPKCLAVIEPVERTTATVTFDSDGNVKNADSQLAYLHGYTCAAELEGLNIKQLIPSFILPKPGEDLSKEVKKQRATGRTKDGGTFPVSVILKSQNDGLKEKDLKMHGMEKGRGTPLTTVKEHPTAETELDNLSTVGHGRTPDPDVNSVGSGSYSSREDANSATHDPPKKTDVIYTAVVWVFTNISGMISFLPDGTIHSINHNFALMLFGYSQDELVGKQITLLIPEFYDHVDMIDDSSMPLPPFDDDDFTRPIFSPEQMRVSPKSDVEITPKGINNECISPSHDLECLSTMELLQEANKLTSQTKESGMGSSRSDSASTADLLRTPSPLKVSLTSEDGDRLGATPPDVIPQVDSRGDHQSCRKDKVQRVPPIDLGDETDDAGIIHAGELMANKVTGRAPPGMADLSLEVNVSVDHDKRTALADVTAMSLDANQSNISQSEEEIQSRTHCDESNVSVQSTDTDELLKASPQQVTNPTSPNDCLSIPLHEHHLSMSSAESQSTAEPVTVREAYTYKKHRDQRERTLGKEDSARGDSPTNRTDGNAAGKTERQCSSGGDSKSESDTSNYNVRTSRQNSRTSLSRQSRSPDNGRPNSSNQVTSTPSNNKVLTVQQQISISSANNIPEGSFTGQARHRDGILLSVIFQIKRVDLDDGNVLYCCWITRDPADLGEGGKSAASLTLASSINSTFDQSALSLGDAITQTARSNSTEPEELSPGRGLYDERYDTLQSIGKGAFGFVKLATRKADRLTVVVKFIRKAKVLSDCWQDDPILGQVPLEIALLAKLDHTNIVKMLEAYENEEFFQVIMDKHGGGMDLFEFIDRQPNMDEKLSSYMFKQVVAAISYLHGHKILHRDIKDENIILDEEFHVKLIDFGSATYLEPGKMFSTFCGTLEYCSPEVLLGNKYHGPELEMWSLGVTLYTLTFSENPFYDVEETIQGIIKPPFLVSTELMQLIAFLLHPEPEWRCTLRELEQNEWLNQRVDISRYTWDKVLPPERGGYYEDSDSSPRSESDGSDPEDDEELITELEAEYQRRLNIDDYQT